MTKAGGPLIQIINRGKVLKWNMHKQTPDAKWHYLSINNETTKHKLHSLYSLLPVSISNSPSLNTQTDPRSVPNGVLNTKHANFTMPKEMLEEDATLKEDNV